MKDIEARILRVFKEHPGGTYTTDDIAREVFIDAYGAILGMQESSDASQHVRAKRLAWKLHRKLLYHLNKLVKEDILMVAATVGKNQKMFKLVMDSGELVVRTKKSTVVLHKSLSYAMPTDVYEESGVVVNHDPNTWMSKVNCVLLEGSLFHSLEELFLTLKDMLFVVNDVVGVHHFDALLRDVTIHELDTFLENVFSVASDFDRRINLLVDLTKITQTEIISLLVEKLYMQQSVDVFLIFYVYPKQFYTRDFYDVIIDMAMRVKGKIYMINKKKHVTPFVVGTSGVFSLSDRAYVEYKKSPSQYKVICLVQSSLAIDIRRFRELDNSAHGFNEVVKKCAMSLLEANAVSRRNMKENFSFVPTLVHANYHAFFRFSRNYIRFWNYEVMDEDFDSFVTLIEETERDIYRFARQEEIVFQSCGIPIRFRLAFSSSFRKFNETLKRAYKKTKTISSLHDFQQDQLINYLDVRERLLHHFNGGDRLRFFRAGTADTPQVKKELLYLLNTVDIPLLCYDFANRVDNVKLQDFF